MRIGEVLIVVGVMFMPAAFCIGVIVTDGDKLAAAGSASVAITLGLVTSGIPLLRKNR